MSGPARRRMAGFGTFLLILSMLMFTMGGLAAGQEGQGGQYEPPAGCIKLEEEGTPRVGVDGPVVVGDVTVTFTWIAKAGEPGEWIGFTWAATGGIAGGTVKAGLGEYSWGPAASGTFTVPEEGGIVHAISFVIVCPGETPTTPATEPTTPATEPTLPPQGSTVPSSVPVSVLPTTVTLAPQQETTTTTAAATLPFTGAPVGAGVVPLAMSLLGMGAAALAVGSGSRRQ